MSLIDDPDWLCELVFGPGVFPSWAEHEADVRRGLERTWACESNDHARCVSGHWCVCGCHLERQGGDSG